MYKISLLPYLYQDLEPFIDTHTMGLHYKKHHQTYLDNLNKLLKENNYDYHYNINELVYYFNEYAFLDKDDILFNLGGVLNHDLFFNSISKYNKLPKGNLLEKINKQYGSYDNFFDKFKEKALQLKGSGYTFLVLKDDNLEIVNFFNQDLPLLHGYIPLFNLDLWEHAYYLNYKNDRAKYIDNFKKVADFTNACNLYDDVLKQIRF